MDTSEQKLQKALQECELLKKENEHLKAILKYHHINPTPYIRQITNEKINMSKIQKINERIQIFKDLFKGRSDVFAIRYEKKDGKSGYTPACKYEWQKPICQKPKIRCSDCIHRSLLPLTDQVIFDHLTGNHTIGLYPLLQDETSWFLAVDFDKKSWQDDVQAFIATCNELRVPASIERSRSGNGCHVWIFMNTAIPASLVRKLGFVLLTHTLSRRFEVGMDSFDRMFPNQDTVPKGGFGNLIALPLQRKPRELGNSIFVDESLKPYPNQWKYLNEVEKMTREHLQKIVNHHYQSNVKQPSPVIAIASIQSEIPSKIKVIEKNGLWIDISSLPSSLVQNFMQLASFNNPEFFKAQAKRISTHGIPRVISCYDEGENFIVLPRGCKEDLETLLNNQLIEVDFLESTISGVQFSMEFKGHLREEQEKAVNNLLKFSTGILSATTGFGKTVVAAALIAKRNTNTLIIVNRKQLLDQWKERLSTFLDLNDFKIGQIGGGKNKPTGILDIATIQSLNYKGEIKDLVAQYGQVIVDECHHISAYSFEQVLKKVEAKYIVGLTATPTRRDGLQPIMAMQLGPIRYKVNSKGDKATQFYDHYLVPRYTNFKSKIKDEKKNIQMLYKELTDDSNRNEMIFNDVLNVLNEGATPLLLTERVEHAKILAARFQGFVKNTILLIGTMGQKERDEALRSLKNLADDEERLIIATGKYVGEGFDHAKLDSLFLTMPISWKGTLQQYVGRIHRLHDHKTTLKVFDYVDKKEPSLNAMFEKRMKGYGSMGYQVFKGKEESSETKQMKLF